MDGNSNGQLVYLRPVRLDVHAQARRREDLAAEMVTLAARLPEGGLSAVIRFIRAWSVSHGERAGRIVRRPALP
jgi:hypothetical protein